MDWIDHFHKVQTFWEAHKNLPNLPYALYISLINVQTPYHEKDLFKVIIYVRNSRFGRCWAVCNMDAIKNVYDLCVFWAFYITFCLFLFFSCPETYQSDKWLRQNRNHYRTFVYLRWQTIANNKMAWIWQRSQPSK